MLHLDQTTASHFCRYDLPFSDPVRITLYGGDFMRGGAEWYRAPMFKNQNGTTLLPEITNGFYLFYDRHGESTDPSNDANLYNRGSYNFDLAVFDRDTNVLYYLVMDT